jgi:hypothetical protein
MLNSYLRPVLLSCLLAYLEECKEHKVVFDSYFMHTNGANQSWQKTANYVDM